MIYEMMPRPPHNMAGVDWRSADGSDNLGRSNMPYSRSVPVAENPDRMYPDENEVFKRLMLRQRSPEGVEHVRVDRLYVVIASADIKFHHVGPAQPRWT